MKIETPFQLIARLISVEAMVAGPSGRSPCHLVFDTAAVYTTLAPQVAKRVGISYEHARRSTVIRSAVGNEHGYLVNLEQVTTLGQLNFEVRPVERRILVEKIAG